MTSQRAAVRPALHTASVDGPGLRGPALPFQFPGPRDPHITIMSMHKILAASLAAGALLGAMPAFADNDLFRKSNCLACHAIEQKRLGPSMKDVALKYANDGGAAAMLATKIQKGGVGNWGQMPMPAQPQVSDADAKKLAEYILSLK